MYRILNMSSATATAGIDDRTTRARIRDAAISCFAEYGVAETTARKVADGGRSVAGIGDPPLRVDGGPSCPPAMSTSPPRFASTSRRHCRKVPTLDVLASLRNTEVGPLMGYLAQVLVDDSEAVAKLVDDLVADAEGYIRAGRRSRDAAIHRRPHGVEPSCSPSGTWVRWCCTTISNACWASISPIPRS